MGCYLRIFLKAYLALGIPIGFSVDIQYSCFLEGKNEDFISALTLALIYFLRKPIVSDRKAREDLNNNKRFQNRRILEKYKERDYPPLFSTVLSTGAVLHDLSMLSKNFVSSLLKYIC